MLQLLIRGRMQQKMIYMVIRLKHMCAKSHVGISGGHIWELHKSLAGNPLGETSLTRAVFNILKV